METLRQIAHADVDFVIHAGDLFDSVRPSNLNIVFAYQALAGCQRERGGKPFFLIAGNHDSPRQRESGHILELFRSIPGMHVATDGVLQVENFKNYPSARVCLVPHPALSRDTLDEVRPSGAFEHNILVLHGFAHGVTKHPEQSYEFNEEWLFPSRWSYVALGDFHSPKWLGENIGYCGSTDYTSSNFWDELNEPKGWVEYDLRTRQRTFHEIHPRRAVNMPRIYCDGKSLEEVQAELESQIGTFGKDEPMVRQVLVGLRSDHRRFLIPIVRQLEKECLSYDLVVQEGQRDSETEAAETREQSKEARWSALIENSVLPLGLAKEDVHDHGLALIKAAEERMNPEAEDATA